MALPRVPHTRYTDGVFHSYEPSPQGIVAFIRLTTTEDRDYVLTLETTPLNEHWCDVFRILGETKPKYTPAQLIAHFEQRTKGD